MEAAAATHLHVHPRSNRRVIEDWRAAEEYGGILLNKDNRNVLEVIPRLPDRHLIFRQTETIIENDGKLARKITTSEVIAPKEDEIDAVAGGYIASKHRSWRF